MEEYLNQGTYQLDEAQFREHYFKTRGKYPSDDIISLYSFIVDIAQTAYIEGTRGRPLRLPSPIKKI